MKKFKDLTYAWQEWHETCELDKCSEQNITDLCERSNSMFARAISIMPDGISSLLQIPKRDTDNLAARQYIWCIALAYKYLGTLEAARGNRDTAGKYFSRATENIQGEEYPIIGFIKMTIYAEAYRSLEIKNYQIAGKKLALQLLDEYANPQAVIPWLEYFEQKNSAEPFVSFWY